MMGLSLSLITTGAGTSTTPGQALSAPSVLFLFDMLTSDGGTLESN
jgi:hypothetical protein